MKDRLRKRRRSLVMPAKYRRKPKPLPLELCITATDNASDALWLLAGAIGRLCGVPVDYWKARDEVLYVARQVLGE
ncbi:MAG: hypothetical protein WC565_06515 [Parcubacteria group bacterium]